jgi:hypothetical protein
MQANKKLSFKTGFLAILCAVAMSWGLGAPQANAQENPRESAQVASAGSSATAAKSSAKRYFVEFRSRSALSYGHAFLVHGKLNAQGDTGPISRSQVAGLHPFTESSVPWSVGHVVPVPAEHGWTDGDTEDEYITARYRVLLTEPEYRDMLGFIDGLNKRTPMWHAVMYNCETYIGDVAKHIGLKTPSSTLVFPDEYIKTMADLNGGTVRTVSSAATSAKTKPAAATARKPAATPAAAKPGSPAAARPAATTKPAASAASSKTAAATPAVQPEPAVRY